MMDAYFFLWIDELNSVSKFENHALRELSLPGFSTETFVNSICNVQDEAELANITEASLTPALVKFNF